ncbi:hypothetical protein QT972_24900 [Microcoleus sp. herbarium7]|uniref:hypothetical protein n=1 Tax=Microcoleus sp. herbarium7 TaxID=3055435 RepID=UPI002FD628AD
MARIRQTSLARPVEPLQIPYPKNFKGARRHPELSEEIFIGPGQFTDLTLDEIRVVEDFLPKLPYEQFLIFGTDLGVLQEGDPLLEMTQEQLDKLEKQENLPSSRTSPNGGDRTIFERVLAIRVDGEYDGNGMVALPAGQEEEQ